jgi:hypothetical protein
LPGEFFTRGVFTEKTLGEEFSGVRTFCLVKKKLGEELSGEKLSAKKSPANNCPDEELSDEKLSD